MRCSFRMISMNMHTAQTFGKFGWFVRTATLRHSPTFFGFLFPFDVCHTNIAANVRTFVRLLYRRASHFPHVNIYTYSYYDEGPRGWQLISTHPSSNVHPRMFLLWILLVPSHCGKKTKREKHVLYSLFFLNINATNPPGTYKGFLSRVTI